MRTTSGIHWLALATALLVASTTHVYASSKYGDAPDRQLGINAGEELKEELPPKTEMTTTTTTMSVPVAASMPDLSPPAEPMTKKPIWMTPRAHGAVLHKDSAHYPSFSPSSKRNDLLNAYKRRRPILHKASAHYPSFSPSSKRNDLLNAYRRRRPIPPQSLHLVSTRKQLMIPRDHEQLHAKSNAPSNTNAFVGSVLPSVRNSPPLPTITQSSTNDFRPPQSQSQTKVIKTKSARIPNWINRVGEGGEIGAIEAKPSANDAVDNKSFPSIKPSSESSNSSNFDDLEYDKFKKENPGLDETFGDE